MIKEVQVMKFRGLENQMNQMFRVFEFQRFRDLKVMRSKGLEI